MKKISLYLLLAIFMVSVVSANGLKIVGENSFNITKQQNVDTTFQVTIENQDSFTFHDINLEDESVGSMNGLLKLDSGQSANVTITLNKNNDFNGELKFTGKYEASLGASNMTEIIDINYDTGVSKCDMLLIKGDRIIWNNEDLDEIKLKNTQTGEYFATIKQGENYTKIFSEETTLEYVAIWITPFTEICKIEVQNDEGLVHASKYDAKVNLDLKISYLSTTI